MRTARSQSLLLILFALVLATGAQAQTYTIELIAGTSDIGDGGDALRARIDEPRFVTVDRNRNIYFSDTHRVRRVSPDGTISTFAGTGIPGFSGDGGPAAEAQIDTPLGLATDALGNIYICDAGNHVIRRVAPDGVITTVVGNGIQGFNGDSRLADTAHLDTPTDVVINSTGEIIFSDAANFRVRRVQTDGIIRTLAGVGVRGFRGDRGAATAATVSEISGVALGADDSIYLVDADRVRRVTTEGIIDTVAGNGISGFLGDEGPATGAQLMAPRDIAINGDGELVIADGSNRLRTVTPAGIIDTTLGNGSLSEVGRPWGLHYDPAVGLVFAEPGNHRVRRINLAGGVRNVAVAIGVGDRGPALDALFRARGLTEDADGSIFLAEYEGHRVRRIAPDGMVSTVTGRGVPGFDGDAQPANLALLFFPTDVATDAEGRVYVADSLNFRVRRTALGGDIETVAGGNRGYSGDDEPADGSLIDIVTGIAIAPDGSYLLADSGNHRIRHVGTDGIITTAAGTGEAGFSGDGGTAVFARITSPTSVRYTNDGGFVFADGTHRVRHVDTSGVIRTIAGSGAPGFAGDGGPATAAFLSSPEAAIQTPEGDWLIADTGNLVVRLVTADGIISTIAGTGSRGGRGENGPATLANLEAPRGLALSADGSILLSDGARIFRLIRDLEPPLPTVESTSNGASFDPDNIARGSLFSIFGLDFATQTASADSLPLPTQLDVVSATLGGVPIGMLFANGTQINGQAPSSLPTGPHELVVTNQNGVSEAFSVTLKETALGLFEFGANRAVVQNQDLTVNQESEPAAAGSIAVAFLTGQGPTNPPVPDGIGAPISPLALAATEITVELGGVDCRLVFAGLSPGFVGLLQVNFEVPATLAPGTYPLVIRSDGFPSNSALLTVGP